MDIRKIDQLTALLKQDEIYQVYDHSIEELRQKLQRREKWIPRKLYAPLCGLIELAELRQCRTLLVICEHMEFKEK